MAQIVIRNRTPEELDRCVELLALVHKNDAYPSNWPDDPARWLTPRNSLHTWVAAQEDRIVGHVMIRGLPAADHAVVSRFFVSPAGRGHGIGRLLLGRAGQWAVTANRRLTLEVDRVNRAAVGLYEAMGWRRTGEYVADWTTPGGEQVTMLTYALDPGE